MSPAGERPTEHRTRSRVLAAALAILAVAALAVASRTTANATTAMTLVARTQFALSDFGRIYVDEAHGHVFVSSPSDDKIQVFGLDGTPVGEITGLSQPHGMLVDGSKLYVAQRGAGNIAVLDASTLAFSKTLGSGLVQPREVVLAGGRLWTQNGVARSETVQLAAVDPTTGAVTSFSNPNIAYDFYAVSNPGSTLLYTTEAGYSGPIFTKFDVSGPTPVVATSVDYNAGSGASDIAITLDGTRIGIADGLAFYVHQRRTSDLSSDGIRYTTIPSAGYTNAAAYASTVVAVGKSAPIDSGDVLVYPIGAPDDQIAFYNLPLQEVLRNRGLAITSSGSRVYAVSGPATGGPQYLTVLDLPSVPGPTTTTAPTTTTKATTTTAPPSTTTSVPSTSSSVAPTTTAIPAGTKLAGGQVRVVKVTGGNGIPEGTAGAQEATGVAAVSLNVTATEAEGDGFVTVYPCGTRPLASNLNFRAGQTVANAVLAPVSPTGTVCFYTSATTHLLADVNGWFPTGNAGLQPLTPFRAFDTRDGTGGVPAGVQIGPDGTLAFQMTGRGAIPSAGVGAVSLNVTVTGATGGGFVTVYPCGPRPVASNLNYVQGQTVPNAVIAPLSADGKVCFYALGATHLVVDVNGWFPVDPSGFQPLAPSRAFDTRDGTGNLPASVRLGSDATMAFPMSGKNGVPDGAVAAVVLNVTVTDPVADGYVTVYPCGARPLASNLNYLRGQTVPNLVIAPVAPDGTVCFYALGATHILADVSGWFPIASSGFQALTPSRLFDTRA